MSADDEFQLAGQGARRVRFHTSGERAWPMRPRTVGWVLSDIDESALPGRMRSMNEVARTGLCRRLGLANAETGNGANP